MKKIFITVLLIFIFTSSVYAANLKNTLKFGSGLVCGLLGHEAAHIIAAQMKGIKIKSMHGNLYHGCSIKYTNPRHSKTFALAGFTEQIISTEIILAKKLYKKSPFWKGYLTFNIVQPTLAILNNNPDLKEYSLSGGNKIALGITINLHSLYTLYRIKKLHKRADNKLNLLF